ncbi:hypothetical protein VTH06DRAFT_7995 [Thermothelomyces fergusii]
MADGLSDEWLMIYDDCPEQDHFRPLLPRRNKGNIIYTSRSQGLRAEIPAQYVCEVPPLGEADAVDLLLKVSGREESEWDWEELGSAREIVASMGYLPIAIESAGSYIREGGCNAITYLQRFRESTAKSEVLSKSNSDASSPARPALYTALDLSYDAIVGVRRRKGRSPVGMAAEYALQALNLLCFYHNERIPARMVECAALERLKWGSQRVCPLYELTDDPFLDPSPLLSLNYPDGTWDPLPFDLGVQTLQRFSLVKLSPNRRFVSMHVMVQTWAQDRMEDAVREKQALMARIVLLESMAVSWNRAEAAWMRTLPSHVKACLSHKAVPVAHDPYQAILDFKLGWYYSEEKRFPEAVCHLSNALRIWKFEKGAYSEPVTIVLDRLANVYNEMGNVADAELAYLEIIDRLQARYRARSLERRRRACERRAKAGRRTRAKSGEQARLRLWRKLETSPAEDQKEAQSRCDEQEGTERMGNDGEDPTGGSAGMPRIPGPSPGSDVGAAPADAGGMTMEQLIEDVKSVVQRERREATVDDFRFELANVFANLARLNFDQGRFPPGAGLIMLAIELLKQSGYPNDVRVWALEDELIRRFQNGGDLRHWARRSSAVHSLPPDEKEDVASHEYLFIWQIGYARFLTNEGSWDEAYQVYQEVLKLTMSHYGAGDRRTLYLLRKMALCQLERGVLEEAEELARTAVERAKGSYGQWNLQTAKCLDTLSIILMSQTRHLLQDSEFWAVTREAYEFARVMLPPDHYLTVRLKVRLNRRSGVESERASRAVAMAAVQECGLSGDQSLEPTKPSEDTGEEIDEFFQHLDRMFAGSYQETKEEYMKTVHAEYREYNKRKLRAREEEEEEKRNGTERRSPQPLQGHQRYQGLVRFLAQLATAK